MSKTKFTKGDWSVEDGRVVVCGDFKVAYSYSGANVPFMERVKANANLISCAPDMYEILCAITDSSNPEDMLAVLIEVKSEIGELLKRARGE